MRWLKHLSNAHDDHKINKLREKFGAEGYGFYWLVLERIAGQMSSSNPLTILGDSAKGWGKFLGTRTDYARKILGYFGESGLMIVRISGDDIEINCPNLLKYKDETTQRVGNRSGTNRAVEEKRIEQNREEKRGARQQPENLKAFNAWIEKRESELVPYFETNYSHVGGRKHLKKVVDQIREAIFLDPNSVKYQWDQHRENDDWGDVVRSWNRIAIRSGA